MSLNVPAELEPKRRHGTHQGKSPTIFCRFLSERPTCPSLLHFSSEREHLVTVPTKKMVPAQLLQTESGANQVSFPPHRTFRQPQKHFRGVHHSRDSETFDNVVQKFAVGVPDLIRLSPKPSFCGQKKAGARLSCATFVQPAIFAASHFAVKSHSFHDEDRPVYVIQQIRWPRP